ncbi:MAG TPA: hypothetical protein VD996_15270 [Chitinophagaceae bacterium]|nr:hypothetical protein [Chitinophagaceae bacterium]
MKHSALNPLLPAAKTFIALSVIAVIALFSLAMKAKEVTDDIWKQLGISQVDANRNIFSSFRDGHLRYSGARLAKNIAEGNRAAVINELGAYAKKYTASAEFKKEYASFRARKKPQEPMLITLTADMVKTQEKERLEKAIKSTEANANHPNPKIKNSVPSRLEALKKELAALDEPDNKTIKQRLDNAARSNEQATKMYNQAVQKFEAEYPESPEPMIKKRLQQILDITADVDYAAELKEVDNKKIFVNPVYEKKPLEWKMAFRAGKPATDAVRAFAQQWLQELK